MQATTPTFHRNGQPALEVPTTDIKRGAFKFTRDEEFNCRRCGGVGRLHSFNHVEGGICFECNGDPTKMKFIKRVKHTVYTAERLAVLEAAQVKRNAAKRAKQIAKAQAEIEAKRPFLDRIAAIAEEVLVRAKQDDDRENYSLASDAGCVIRHSREHGEQNLASWVTEKRVAALESMVARMRADAEKVADAPPVEEGRRTVEGKVVSTKVVESHFGYRPTYTLKMLVEDEAGNKYWGTVPSSIDAVERGQLVRFTANVTRSDKDEHFGIFKRPSAAEVVSA